MSTTVANLVKDRYVLVSTSRSSVTLQSTLDAVRIAFSTVEPAVSNTVFHVLSGSDSPLTFNNVNSDIWALATTDNVNLIITETGLVGGAVVVGELPHHNGLVDKQGGTSDEFYHLTSLQYDQQIINEAVLSQSTLNYTDGVLSSINYADTLRIINNSKSFTYLSGLLSETSHVFTYDSQTWTVSTSLTYTQGSLTGVSKSIGKV